MGVVHRSDSGEGRRAAASGEGHLVQLPELSLVPRCRLFPPALFHQDILPAVVVHVADTQPVREALVVTLRRNRREFPRLSPIAFRPVY